jgi:NAD(P)H-hydrate epimerase
LNAFAGQARELRGEINTIVLTPHPGEMARLLGCSTSEVQARRLAVARQAADDWNCYIILKGHHTVVAAPDGPTWVNPTGNPGMGTGGTGDVLAGMLAGLTAQYGAESWGALLGFAVYLHGLAGDLAAAKVGEAPLMATDLIGFLSRAYKHFYSECGRG